MQKKLQRFEQDMLEHEIEVLEYSLDISAHVGWVKWVEKVHHMVRDDRTPFPKMFFMQLCQELRRKQMAKPHLL